MRRNASKMMHQVFGDIEPPENLLEIRGNLPRCEVLVLAPPMLGSSSIGGGHASYRREIIGRRRSHQLVRTGGDSSGAVFRPRESEALRPGREAPDAGRARG